MNLPSDTMKSTLLLSDLVIALLKACEQLRRNSSLSINPPLHFLNILLSHPGYILALGEPGLESLPLSSDFDHITL